jgi:hypothetical protein
MRAYDGGRREETGVSLPPTQRRAAAAAYNAQCRWERAGGPRRAQGPAGPRCAGSLPGPGSFHTTRGARGGENASGAACRSAPCERCGDHRWRAAQPNPAETLRHEGPPSARRGGGVGRGREGAPPGQRGPAPSEAREGPATSVIAACALLLLSACAVNPVTGRHELMLVSESEEVRLGREGAEQVAAEMGIFPDAPLTA